MKMTLKSILKLMIFGAAISLLGSCATDQAAKVRNDRSSTVGIWGAAYRPTGSVGVVADLQGMVSKNSSRSHIDESGEVQSGRAKLDNLQEVKSTDSRGVDIGVHVYPSQKSAFFYGLGVERKKRTVMFESHNVGSSLVDPSFSNVEVSDQTISVGPSVGYDWIWPNGMSALLDIGPRWEVSKSRSVSQDVSEREIDATRRDLAIKKIDESRGLSLLSPRLIVGYSW